jgi:hypothetical protein
MSTTKEPFQQSIDEIAVALKTDLRNGLRSTELRERLIGNFLWLLCCFISRL